MASFLLLQLGLILRSLLYSNSPKEFGETEKTIFSLYDYRSWWWGATVSQLKA